MKEGSICNKCNHRAHCAMSDEANNDNATIKGCYLYSEQTAKTNADRIRSMRDGELANFFDDIETKAYMSEYRGELGWLDWLKQEATDG